MNALKKYKVSIFGESYTLVSDEAEECILASAHAVDEHMKDITEKSGLTDQKRIAVLAALQLASKLKACELVLEDRNKRENQLINQIERELSSTAM